MIDRFRLWAKGGDGGNGCSSFRRSRQDRRGRPDGMFVFAVILDLTVLRFLIFLCCLLIVQPFHNASLMSWSHLIFFLLEHLKLVQITKLKISNVLFRICGSTDQIIDFFHL